MEILRIDSEKDFSQNLTREEFVDFLYVHLDQFGDDKESINNCIDYALSKEPGKGGFLTAAYEGDEMVGALIMNNTGMKGFIPENCLVYVAVHKDKRGKGYGGKICKHAIDMCDGNVKLHVEYENPAKRLYERLGFTSKYAEMRYEKK